MMNYTGQIFGIDILEMDKSNRKNALKNIDARVTQLGELSGLVSVMDLKNETDHVRNTFTEDYVHNYDQKWIDRFVDGVQCDFDICKNFMGPFQRAPCTLFFKMVYGESVKVKPFFNKCFFPQFRSKSKIVMERIHSKKKKQQAKGRELALHVSYFARFLSRKHSEVMEFENAMRALGIGHE
mmetsp:Transcript_6554/g.24591  ORF Transcript_6554/g.24591 Transcript_6554/m.24591 type:complete len:182 (+) Transcript_6554:1400-1945(+)